MDNPNKSLRHSLLMIAFGIAIGGIPGLIQVDQMRRELQMDTAQAQKLTAEARKQIVEAMGDAVEAKRQMDAAHTDCQNAILGDGARTILADLNHRYQGSAVFTQTLGVMLEIPDGHREQFAASPGPIWVVPRAINPRVIADGVFGGVYTHIWPDGRTDGWHMPSRAE